MPLLKGKSKPAFEHNIKAEMSAGKPQDQALAIAYSQQRRAKKKMAHGGQVERDIRPMPDKARDKMELGMYHPMDASRPEGKQLHVDSETPDMEFQKQPRMEMHEEARAARDESSEDSKDPMELDMVERIMRKRMAKGGMVDLAAEEAEHANAYYPINEHDVVGKEWDDEAERHSDEDSHGMSEDHHSPEHMDMDSDMPAEDVFDHIDRIMSRMNKKRK